MKFCELRGLLKQDRMRYPIARRKGGGFMKSYFLYPGFRFTVWLRLCHYALGNRYLRLFFPLIRWRYYRHRLLTGIQIGLGAEIEGGLYMPHFGSIIVNPHAKVGSNLYLSHNVTIGKAKSEDGRGVTTIGEGVYIGAGAVLLGKIKIGNNAAIGVNSVVLEDVPDNAFVVGAPARVVSYDGARLILGDE